MIFTTVGYKAHVHGSVSLFVIAIEVDKEILAIDLLGRRAWSDTEN